MSQLRVDEITDEAGNGPPDFPFGASGIAGKAIGEVFYLWDHLSSVNAPDNSGDMKFIKLTANEDGSGDYNEGLLSGETVSGSAPLVEATAEIATGPLQGETVHLINTEEAVLRARETSGELQFDQMQRIAGSITRVQVNTSAEYFGVFTQTFSGFNNPTSGSGGVFDDIDFNSANSPDARASTDTNGETRAKNVSATAYMRIA